MTVALKIDVVMEHYEDLMWPGQDVQAMWRVLGRVGFVSAETDQERQEELDGLPLSQPNGFKMAVSHVGAKYCCEKKPLCKQCPLLRACEWARARLEPQDVTRSRDLFHAGNDTRE